MSNDDKSSVYERIFLEFIAKLAVENHKDLGDFHILFPYSMSNKV